MVEKKFLAIIIIAVAIVSLIAGSIISLMITPTAPVTVITTISTTIPTTIITTLSPTKPSVVRVLAVAGPEAECLKKYAPEFEKQTGITASIEVVTRDVWGFRKIRELIEDAGLYDVVFIGGGDDALSIKLKGHWIPLDKYLTKEEIDIIYHKDYWIHEGKLMGVPQYYNFPMLFYRKDLLNDPREKAAFKEKYGRELTVPKTYDELYEVAEFFHRPPELYGFFIGGVDWSIFLDHTYFVYGMGANYGDLKTGDLTLNTPEQKRAMQALTRMTKFNPPGWETLTFFDGDQLMLNGKIFMYQNWFYIWRTFTEKMPDKIGIAPPVGDKQPGAHLGAFIAVIPKAAPNPDAGAKFIKWMMSYDYQKKQTIETGNLPMRVDVLKDPEVRKAIPNIEEFEKTMPYLTFQYTTIPGEISSGVAEAIWKVLKGEMTPDEACDWLQNVKFKDRKAIP
jgi:multiple sugar transport system substrate-binding protein